ncbi:MAG: hypothetical protein ACLPKZ_01150, partial [Acidimicrobiales bacterium]
RSNEFKSSRSSIHLFDAALRPPGGANVSGFAGTEGMVEPGDWINHEGRPRIHNGSTFRIVDDLSL